MESLTFIIIAVIITSIGFLIGYQMIRLRKNVDKITDQIIEHHKGDRSFRDKEFVHYFKAGGNIWLSAMDDKFKKMLSMQKYTAMAAIVVAVVIIALSIVQKVYPLSAYPVLLILFLGKNLLDFRSVASDDKTNSKNAVEYYKKSYPEDSSAKNSSEGRQQTSWQAGSSLPRERPSVPVSWAPAVRPPLREKKSDHPGPSGEEAPDGHSRDGEAEDKKDCEK